MNSPPAASGAEVQRSECEGPVRPGDVPAGRVQPRV
jgi:hypothetical protein